ncbi:MAG: ribonuclease Z [Lentisphaerae bacterium]|nr:ribonuclease Z [Lentisphaerota bacterium]
MKITLLGTSHGDPTKTRFNTSSLIEEKGHLYLVDAGECATASLIRMDLWPEMIEGVFITHMHLDHTGGLPMILEQGLKRRRRFPEIDPAILLPDPDAENFLRQWLKVNHVKEENLHRISSFQTGEIFNDGIIKVESFPTSHIQKDPAKPDAGSYGFRITAGDKKVFFTGDLSPDFSDFPSAAADGCDALVCELVHFTPESACERLVKLDLGRLVFTHLGNPWQEPENQVKLTEMYKTIGYPMTIGYDGFQFTV